MDGTVPQDVRERIRIMVDESHQENVQKVKALDDKFRGLYTITEGLVNNSSEAIRGFGKVAAALDIRQQLIVRRSGPFVKPAPPKAGGKQLRPGAKPVPKHAVSSAQNAQKKKRSRGKGRKVQGLPAHPAPPPHPPRAPTPRPAPAKARFQSTDIRVTQGLLPPNTIRGDLRDHLERRHQPSREEDSNKSSSKAKSGASSKDRGRVGQHGGSQSSSHHRGQDQDRKRSPPHSGPPRVSTKSSTATSQSSGTSSSHARDQAKRTKSSSDQGRRSDDPDWRARDSKVRYLTVEVSWGSVVCRWYLLGIG